MSLGLTRPPLADSMMLTLTSHYTATNAKHHRYAATNLPTAADGDAPRAAQIGAIGRSVRRPGPGGRETTDVGQLGVRETGYICRAGRLGDGFTSAGPDVRETTNVGRLGVRETGPLTVRDVSGVCRLWHERNGCFPGCKRSETPVGRQDGPRRAGGTAADL
jgi:hypothetical protein